MTKFIPDKDIFYSYFLHHSRKQLASHFGITISAVDKLCKFFNFPRKAFQYRDIEQGFTVGQMDVITGSLLGDGGLQSVGVHHRKNSKFVEVHSLQQYGLLSWKMQKLCPFSRHITTKEVNGRKRNECGKIITDTENKLHSCRMETIVHPVFTELERKWYLRDSSGNYVLQPNGRRIKIIPDDVVLTIDVVAVWYFDDGSNNAKNRQATFNTQSFSLVECKRLAEQLLALGINCSTAKNRDAFVIIVGASSYLDFIAMMRDRIPHDCVSHKVDLSHYKSPDYSTRFVKK